MRPGWYILCCSLWILIGIRAQAQDSIPDRQIKVSGYIKDLQSLLFDKDLRHVVASDLLHNRVNIKWKPAPALSGALEIRNRVIWGEQLAATSGFADQVTNSGAWVDLSKTWVNRSDLILVSNIERFWIEWHDQRWNFRAGRQRINWGITTMWNPNDIFNTYNFLDFDYEERPGSDAVKGSYHFNAVSGLEFALAGHGAGQGSTGAMRFFTNKWNYDFQFISGWYGKGFTAGGGWAGSIKDAGFKGEFMYFAPRKDSAGQLNLAMEWDYVFKKGWYLNIGGLLNTNGPDRPVSGWATLDFNLSPKNILPVRWAAVLTSGKELTPLFSANISVVYSPGVNLLILLPGVKYNLATNLDADIIWQSFFAKIDGAFGSIAHNGFLRLRWSF
ncbi:MAG: hypothetical protein Q8927_18630 [Bacteroidota bacterium]|nr:hypothetical protein [Bacteroidota bacterium]MDP4218221.1 hypothetical protein [Bacteroidota bacterium]MDP4246335.1 hypothetical protein [Bacteroidota bacterium]MDP4256197.1 hypothetical protein [Bacteroidota bacterium]MDP4260547.1 hypothetical protein [Bacteroidota bacterium]